MQNSRKQRKDTSLCGQYVSAFDIASKLQNSWKHERKKDTYSFNSDDAKKTNHGCP